MTYDKLVTDARNAIVARKATQSEGHAVALGTFSALLEQMLHNPTTQQRDYVVRQLNLLQAGIDG